MVTKKVATSIPKFPSHKVFMCFAPEDKKRAEEIRTDIEVAGNVSVVSFDNSQQCQSGENRVADIHREIGSADAFLLLISKESFETFPDDSSSTKVHSSFDISEVPLKLKKWLEYQYCHAIAHKNNSPNKHINLVKATIEEMPNELLLPAELSAYAAVDYSGDLSDKTSLDPLLNALTNKDSEFGHASKEYVFTQPTNPRLEAFKRVFHTEFNRAYSKHMDPVNEKLETLANLRKAQDNLMTPELISVKEASAYDDIWVVSHTLNNDLHTDIGESVKKNLKNKGIHYTYFVPNSDLIKRRMPEFNMVFDEFRKDPAIEKQHRTGDFKFITLDVGVFMPFDELVIYDGENTTHRWGYIQMSYERANADPLFMKIPDRTLSTVIEYLLHLKKAGQKNVNSK